MNNKIMVIEDEEVLLSAISLKLKNSGYEPIEFSNAQDAISFLQSAEELPAAIWLDYYLKDMNGIDFMHALNNNQKLVSIPVVVVSNSASDEKVSALAALGAKKYLLKADHTLEELVESIKDLINNNEENTLS